MSNSSWDVFPLSSETVFRNLKLATISSWNPAAGSGPSAPFPRPANGGSQKSADSSTAAPSTSAATHCSRTTPAPPRPQQQNLPPLLPPPSPPLAPAPSGGRRWCPSPASFPIRPARDLTHPGPPPPPPPLTAPPRPPRRELATNLAAAVRVRGSLGLLLVGGASAGRMLARRAPLRGRRCLRRRRCGRCEKGRVKPQRGETDRRSSREEEEEEVGGAPAAAVGKSSLGLVC